MKVHWMITANGGCLLDTRSTPLLTFSRAAAGPMVIQIFFFLKFGLLLAFIVPVPIDLTIHHINGITPP
jgi:hypothetical protein